MVGTTGTTTSVVGDLFSTTFSDGTGIVGLASCTVARRYLRIVRYSPVTYRKF